MTEFLYWSGVLVWATLCAGVVCLVWVIVRHAFDASVFVFRTIDLCGWKEPKPPRATIVASIAREVWRFFWNPVVCVQNTDGRKAYWPGREPN